MSNNRCRPTTYTTIPLGPRGAQGEQGPPGPAGPAGPPIVSAYGGFFNTNQANIEPSCLVPICYSMMSALPVGMTLVNCNILLDDVGVYLIDYSIYTDNDSSFGLCLCGNLVMGSTTDGKGYNHASVLITTQMPCQMISLVNIGTSTSTLITPSTSSANVIVTVLKIK